MKKRNWLLALVLLIAVFALTACGGDATPAATPTPKPAAEVSVTFDLNYEGAPAATVQKIKEGDVAEEPAKPVRENYEFTGWYADAAASKKFDFEEAIYEAATVYAGWKQIAVTVTFDANYEGGPVSAQTVAIGETASQPAAPEREGYLFTAWYEDSAAQTAFDFSTPISENKTLYAGWEEDSGDNVRLTYHWNYEGAPDDGIAEKATIKTNSKTKAYAAVREGYYFGGWYTEPECVEKFDFSKRIKSSVDLYARWLDTYVFEAEYVDFTGMIGNGYSGNQSGVGLIVKQKDAGQQASNGHYVGWMYRYGNTLTFNIECDRDVADAVIVLRLSAEFYDMTFTSDTLAVQVNGENLKYDSISITGVPAQGTNTWKTFNNYTISTAVPLKQGANTISLIVNNEDRLGESGTMYATAPLFDCLFVYTDAQLTWEPLTDNLNGNIS